MSFESMLFNYDSLRESKHWNEMPFDSLYSEVYNMYGKKKQSKQSGNKG